MVCIFTALILLPGGLAGFFLIKTDLYATESNNVNLRDVQGARTGDGLIAQWNMDEGKGAHVGDTSGNGCDGILDVGGSDDPNSKWVNGIRGKALDFDGTNDSVNCGEFDPPPQGTILFWMNARRVTWDKDRIIGGDDAYEIKALKSGTGYIITNDLWIWGRGVQMSKRVLNYNEWYHIACTYDTSKLKEIYINGVLDISEIRSHYDPGTDPFFIGVRNGTIDYFDGIIDEVAIYARALNPQEIRAHYSNATHFEQDGFGGSWFDDFEDKSWVEGGLGEGPLEADKHTVGLWHFNEGTGTVAWDASGKGNDGTLHGLAESDWVKGRFKKGLRFEGKGGHVDMGDPNDNSLEASGTYTLESWIRTKTMDSDMIISKKGDGPRGFYLATTDDGKLKVHFQGDGGVASYNSNSVINDNTWHYLVVVIDANGVNTYIDGSFDSSSDSNPGDCSNTMNFKIGVSEHSSAYWYSGIIDEVRISNIARTPEVIRRNYEGALVLRNGKVELNCSQYRRRITITNKGDVLSDFPVQLNLTKQNFDYDHVKSTGEDIRFKTLDGKKLSYWIEDWDTNGPSKIWVNVTNIPKGNSKIMMEYGNPEARTKSNGEEVFEFFDDFKAPVLDAAKWGKYTYQNGGTVTIDNGKLKILTGSGQHDTLGIRTQGNFSIPYVFKSSSKFTASGRSSILGLINSSQVNPTSAKDNLASFKIEISPSEFTSEADGTNFKIDFQNWDNKAYLDFEIRRDPNGKSVFFIDDKIIDNDHDYSPLDDTKLWIVGAGWNEEVYSDWVFIRKSAINEPTATLDNEEQNPNKAILTSTTITSPLYNPWNILSITKTEPLNTFINVSIINAVTNKVVPGYENRTDENIHLYMLTDLGVRSIRLRAYFSCNGSVSPSLDSWGVEWSLGDSWRDGFTGDGKLSYPYGVDKYTVGYWSFEEGRSDVAHDFSRNNNNGVMYNMDNSDWVNGRYGRGLEFDGVEEYIQVPFDESLNISEAITIEAWINTATNSDTTYILRKSGVNYSYEMRLELSGQLSMIFEDKTIFSVTTVPVDQWIYVVGTYDGSHMTLYINGELDNRIKYSGGIMPGDDELYLGAPSSEPDMGFNGTLDEIRISKIARTPAEVYQAYMTRISFHDGQAQLDANELLPDKNSRALWNFNEGSGNLIHDSSGNGNDGLIYGPIWSNGVIGGALEFDGQDDYVEAAGIGTSPEGTIECWARWENPIEEHGTYPAVAISQRGIDGMNLARLGVSPDADITSRQIGFAIFDYPWHSVSSGVVPVADEWYHIVGTWGPEGLKIYINGEFKGANPGYTKGMPSNNNTYVGGSNVGLFKGSIDELGIYDRSLTPSEVRTRANHYRQNASIRSLNITLPINNTWESFHFSRSVPHDTYLNISLHDARTNKTLYADTNLTEKLFLDISELDPATYPSICFRAYFQSSRTETPVIYDWAVNWTTVPEIILPPELNRDIPTLLNVTEDTPRENLVDLEDHFIDIYSSINITRYALQSDPSNPNITLVLKGPQLDVVHLAENWTGNVSVIANCTNAHGLSTPTNMFNISVTPVDDAPVWHSRPPNVTLNAGVMMKRTQYSLDDFVIDAERDEWDFIIRSNDINASRDNTNKIILRPGEFIGNTSINVTVFQISDESLYANITIPVEVQFASIGVKLLSPKNNTTITESSFTLEWELKFPGLMLKNILHDLHFGVEKEPSLYQSDLNRTNYTVTDLMDQTWYYWYIDSSNAVGGINGTSPIWSFFVDKDAQIPEVNNSYPLNGDIITTTNVNLSWKTINPLGENLSFDVYLGDSEDNLSLFATTRNESFYLEGMVDGTTYFWKVIPWSGRITGRSNSGIWNFTVDMGFVPFYDISWDTDKDLFSVIKGKTISFNLFLNNTGNNVDMVIIEKVSPLAKKAAIFKTNFNIPPGKSDMTNVDVHTSEFNVGIHIFSLKLIHGGGKKEQNIEIEINITGHSPTDPSKPETEGNSLLLALIVVFILLFIVVIFALIYMKKRRDEENTDYGYVESDAIEADIVHMPVHGQTQSPPVPGPRYRFKGRDASVMGSPIASKQPVTDMGNFDISKLHLPSDPDLAGPPVDIKHKFLALPPARFLEVKQEEQRVPIEELFLMTPGGLLVQHYSLQRETGMNEDVLASMLSAVKSFIMDSLAMLEKETGEESEVNRIDVGKYSVMMATERSLALIAISSHERKEIILDQIKKGVSILEEKFGSVMVEWDGDMSKVEGVKPYVEALVRGEFDPASMGIMAEQTLPEPPLPGPELPAGLKSVTIALPDPIKIPDTAKVLPEKSEVIAEESAGTDILSALEDILAAPSDRTVESTTVSPSPSIPQTPFPGGLTPSGTTPTIPPTPTTPEGGPSAPSPPSHSPDPSILSSPSSNDAPTLPAAPIPSHSSTNPRDIEKEASGKGGEMTPSITDK